MSSLELRSRAAELLKTSQEVALGSPSTVVKVRAHRLFCDLLRLPASSPFRRIREETLIDEGLSESLRGSDITDRILSCADVPDIPVIDLTLDDEEETASPGCPACEPQGSPSEEAAGMRLRPCQASEPSEETTEEDEA